MLVLCCRIFHVFLYFLDISTTNILNWLRFKSLQKIRLKRLKPKIFRKGLLAFFDKRIFDIRNFIDNFIKLSRNCLLNRFEANCFVPNKPDKIFYDNEWALSMLLVTLAIIRSTNKGVFITVWIWASIDSTLIFYAFNFDLLFLFSMRGYSAVF